MVRRSTVDRSPQSDVYGADYAAGTGTGDLAQGGGKRDRTARGWRGAGGRWLVWVFRVVVWLVLLVIGYRGVTAIVLGEGTGRAPATTATPASTFPSGLAGAYALQFGQVYLNASPATASQRASQLAAFLPPGADPQLGWNGTGTLQLQSEQVADVAVKDSQHAVVTLLARVNGQLMELGVPVYYAGGALAVSAEPAWLAGAAAGIGSHAPGAQHRHGDAGGTDEPAACLLPGLRQREPGHARPLPGPRHSRGRPGRPIGLRLAHRGYRPAWRADPPCRRHRGMACPGPGQPVPGGHECTAARRAGNELCTDDREAGAGRGTSAKSARRSSRRGRRDHNLAGCTGHPRTCKPSDPGVDRCRSIH